MTGDLSVRFTPDLPTDRLVLRLWPNAPRTAAGGARLDVGAVSVDGAARRDARPDPTTVVVPISLTRGRTVVVELTWRLRLPGSVPDRVARVGDTVRLGSFFPLLAWEPGVGWATEPPTSAFGEATTSPAADVDLQLELPPGLDALATGVRTAPDRWHAVGVRDVGVSVGRFRLAQATAHAPQPVDVTVGVAAGVSESPEAYVAKEVRVLEALARRFGPYPWPAFTMAVTPGLPGGIEYPAHVMQGPGRLGRTTSHEAAHQWFYALVGNDQARDPWLDEGLATYAEGGLEGTLERFRRRAVTAGARGRAGAPMTFWETRRSSYYAGVYVQGAQALAAVGAPGVVDCALRRYVALHAYRIARPADLFAAIDAIAPGRAQGMAAFGIRP